MYGFNIKTILWGKKIISCNQKEILVMFGDFQENEEQIGNRHLIKIIIALVLKNNFIDLPDICNRTMAMKFGIYGQKIPIQWRHNPNIKDFMGHTVGDYLK